MTFSRSSLIALLLMVQAWFLTPILAAPVPLTPVAEVYAGTPFVGIVPQPQEASFAEGTLSLEGLELKLEGNAQALQWAARDLGDELRIRLGAQFASFGQKQIRIGTLEHSDLRQLAQAKGVLPDRAEGYGLWVDGSGAGVIGFDALGAYRGVQSLRQLLSKDGFRFVRLRDWPGIGLRMAMIYLDSNSKGINDLLVPLLARLKFSHVLVMSNYVQWDSSKNIHHAGGASKSEARRVAELIRSYGMEPIPLIETLGHTQWLFINGQNREIMQDPESKDPYAYDTLNERTYQVILPILSEAVEVFKPKFVHIGHDEVRSRDRFPARENGIALGFSKLFVDDTVRLFTHLKSLGVGTMIWHDTALGDAFRDQIVPNLPKEIVVTSWHYTPADDYPALKIAQDNGFQVLGSSWFPAGNPEAMARAVGRVNALGALQTRWTGYFGNSSIFDGQAEQGIAYIAAANAFWNPASTPAPTLENTQNVSPNISRTAPTAAGPAPLELVARYRDAYRPAPYRAVSGRLVDLSGLVTRQLSDADERQWIQKGPQIDLSNLPVGVQRLGAYTFQISGAVMLKGARSAAMELPASVVLELNAKASSLAILHTCGWSSPITSPRSKVGQYQIEFEDGSKQTQILEYGRQISAWTDLNTRSVVQDPAWRGKTKDDLDVGISVLVWNNPSPEKTIKRIVFSSEGLQSNPTLLGLSLLDRNP